MQYAVDHPDEDVLEWRGVEADGQVLQDAQGGREHDGHGGVEDSFGGMKVVAVEPDQQGEGRDERHGEKDAERGEEEGPKDREDGGVNGRGRVRAAVHRLRRVLRLARCAEDTAAARRCVCGGLQAESCSRGGSAGSAAGGGGGRMTVQGGQLAGQGACDAQQPRRRSGGFHRGPRPRVGSIPAGLSRAASCAWCDARRVTHGGVEPCACCALVDPRRWRPLACWRPVAGDRCPTVGRLGSLPDNH